jgi:hypothetical protein
MHLEKDPTIRLRARLSAHRKARLLIAFHCEFGGMDTGIGLQIRSILTIMGWPLDCLEGLE